MTTLQSFKDQLAKDLYGQTVEEAVEKDLCISCGRVAAEHCYSEAGQREYHISGLCEECFDEAFR